MRIAILLLCLVSLGYSWQAQESAEEDGPPDDGKPAASSAPSLPNPVAATPAGGSQVEWTAIGRTSLRFVGLMHAFRWATEPGTRAGGIGLGRGYLDSIGNLHGWADGDPFYVNYVGHPMQGAVSGRIFLAHDHRYNRAEFGQSAEYWKGKLRAAAFAWAFSEQFEIGPLSEASIGHIQKQFPQVGFVDHVVTPALGLSWALGEDALDRYLIKWVEGKTGSTWIRIAARTALNPSRSFANVIDGRVPWFRDSRVGVRSYVPVKEDRVGFASRETTTASPAPFEFTLASAWRDTGGGAGCAGGGAEAAWRFAPSWQLVLDVNGCKMVGLVDDLSGDGLVYLVGPRWTPSPAGKWSPYVHVLVGGVKITHEQMFPDEKLAVEEANRNLDPSLAYTLHDQYTRRDEAGGVAVTAGTGLDYRLNSVLAFRVARVEYLHSTVTRGVQVSTGMVLRLGTW